MHCASWAQAAVQSEARSLSDAQAGYVYTFDACNRLLGIRIFDFLFNGF